MAECYDKAGEKVVILNVREAHVYPFDAPDWLDLRAAFFLSLTDDTADDTITGLAETMGLTGIIDPTDRYWIGVKKDNDRIPDTFVGFTNEGGQMRGDSELVSSDIGVGTTNANYWRPRNALTSNWSAAIFDGGFLRRASGDGIQQHFVQNVAGAGGYAAMLGIQLTRPQTNSRVITARIKTVGGGHSADMLYSSTPTEDLLRSSIESWPAVTQQLGPIEISTLPDTLFFYWPFRNSRLRIHSVAVLKAR